MCPSTCPTTDAASDVRLPRPARNAPPQPPQGKFIEIHFGASGQIVGARIINCTPPSSLILTRQVEVLAYTALACFISAQTCWRGYVGVRMMTTSLRDALVSCLVVVMGEADTALLAFSRVWCHNQRESATTMFSTSCSKAALRASEVLSLSLCVVCHYHYDIKPCLSL